MLCKDLIRLISLVRRNERMTKRQPTFLKTNFKCFSFESDITHPASYTDLNNFKFLKKFCFCIIFLFIYYCLASTKATGTDMQDVLHTKVTSQDSQSLTAINPFILLMLYHVNRPRPEEVMLN